METWMLPFVGLGIGVAASFTGLGGGFVVVPLLLLAGYAAPRAVGTSFMVILVVAISSIFAHQKLGNVDWKAGLLLGVGGIIGAQIGARLVEGVSQDVFKKIFAGVLVGLAVFLFFKK